MVSSYERRILIKPNGTVEWLASLVYFREDSCSVLDPGTGYSDS